VTDIDATLGDPDVMSANATAVVEIDEQVNQLKAATGLTDAEVISIPFLHQDYNGYSVALQPGTVNGLVPKPGHFWAPDPHGPRADGGDIMKTAMEEQLAPFGVQVSWVEDWDMFHRLAGEVHCGSNTLRAKPTRGWWESNQ